MRSRKEVAIIIGAGPAGLTAALELLRHTEITPIVLERSDGLGGISRTVTHGGNRLDIGGHRFFSKSDRVMQWWLDILPLQRLDDSHVTLTYQQRSRDLAVGGGGPDPEHEDRVMLLRSRQSRIYFRGKFFAYPVTLSAATLRGLGLWRAVRIASSYVRSCVLPIRNANDLESFFINRFGRELYETFFKSYTEKVWGVPCRRISAEWGAQRVKGLSIRKVVLDLIRRAFPGTRDLAQKTSETSLIERFLYPKLGPGQLWEEVARQVTEEGGEVLTGWEVGKILTSGEHRVRGVRARHLATGDEQEWSGEYVFSSMPVRELIHGFDGDVPDEVREVAHGLVYRDFITIGLLARRLLATEDDGGLLRDNWIYIQEPGVELGRLQILNNWSPYMVADPSTVWMGLEYFCNHGDALWRLSDRELTELAIGEMARMALLDPGEILDSTVIRVPCAYPAYFGSYDRFNVIRQFTDRFENLFLVGRNGMHKYNNQDHSMLTAMIAVENILANRTDKSNLWAINTEEDYHEGAGAGRDA